MIYLAVFSVILLHSGDFIGRHETANCSGGNLHQIRTRVIT